MIQVFILSRNRPIYLWNCLDSLYRLTKSAVQFQLIDSHSDDPLVARVIDGFRRRSMFHSVTYLEKNEPSLVRSTIAANVDAGAEFFGFIESDVVLLAGDYDCWVERMRMRMEADPRLAMLGSFDSPSDLVSMETARRISPGLTDQELKMLTHNEYFRPDLYEGLDMSVPIVTPHNPSGRLLMLRREAVMRAGSASDSDLHDRLVELGYRTGVSTEVRHRHLSLCNIFDYPDYDVGKRSRFMYGYTYKAQLEEKIASESVVLVDDPDVHVLAGGRRIDAARREGSALVFEIPEENSGLFLVSRTGFALGTEDLRPLGIAVDRLVADGVERLGEGDSSGWYAPEEGWRWMSGRAAVPRCSRLEVNVVGTMRYVLEGDRNSC